ncbi:MAG: VOC family protein [Gemmatimonadaceae bacterium]|nr:VOC family protein [Gemmatimonadaceae bacterium]
MHGQFCWYELSTPDPAGSQRFYRKLTAWGTQAFDKDYTMWTLGGVPIAGIFRLTDDMRKQGVPPNWMPYVESDDVDATAARAASSGGKVVVPPSDVPGTGRFAVLQDPQGAFLGIYKSSVQSGGWDGTPVVGRFSWHELMTTDYRKALEWYGALFGWEKTSEVDLGGGAMYAMFGKGRQMYGGMYNRMPQMGQIPPHWLMYIHVRDVGKAVAAATKAGATVHRARMEIPGGTIAILGDPQGAAFAVHDLMSGAATVAPPAKASAAVKKAAKAVRSVAKKAKKAAPRTAKKKKVARAAARTRSKVKAKVTRRKTRATKPRAAARKAKSRRPASRKPAPKARRAGKARARGKK